MVKQFAAISLFWIATMPVAHVAAQTPAPLASPTGDAKHGKELYEKTYRCYACHGYDGQTGSPRLVPMMRNEDGFIGYVRKPATEGMPKFSAVPQRELADIYAYIRSIPQAAPPIEGIPLLKGVIDRRAQPQR